MRFFGGKILGRIGSISRVFKMFYKTDGLPRIVVVFTKNTEISKLF